ncbi:MAG: hypothetical protein ACKVVT_17325 [Dehalococcoidia bacterium]
MWADLIRQYGSQIEMRDVDRDTAEGRKWADEHRLYSQPGFVIWDAEGALTYQRLGPSTRDGLIALVQETATKAQ